MSETQYPDKTFFDTVRPLFGKLTQGQVDGLSKIVQYGQVNGYSRPDLAYVLATAFHETGKWMQPLREGAYRYGPSYSDASAKRAVKKLKTDGIIRTNYALPAGPYGQSYYGRGLAQITWYDNYLEQEKRLGVPLTKEPDLALTWPVALDIIFQGMRDGTFRKSSLKDVPDVMDHPDFTADMRDIVNGDITKNGPRIAGYAGVFWKALVNYSTDADKDDEVPAIVAEKGELDEPSTTNSSWPPRWWPFRAD